MCRSVRCGLDLTRDRVDLGHVARCVGRPLYLATVSHTQEQPVVFVSAVVNLQPVYRARWHRRLPKMGELFTMVTL